MMKFGMFNSVSGDRRYKADDFASYFATFIGNGIFPNPSDGLQIIGNIDSMSVTVRPGKAWIKGYYLINDDDYTLTLDKGDLSLNRIDRIVVRLDFIERTMSVQVKKGALSASPIAPVLKRDADAYEMALADVYVAKGALTVIQANITDLRLNNSLCGIVHGLVDQVDTTTIFNQYQSWFDNLSVEKMQEFQDWQTEVTTGLESWINDEQTDFVNWRNNEESIFTNWYTQQAAYFVNWFNEVKGQLSTDPAGNLYNMITAELPLRFIKNNVVYNYGLDVTDDFKGLIFKYKREDDE